MQSDKVEDVDKAEPRVTKTTTLVRPRRRRIRQPDRLEDLPNELLYLIVSKLDLSSFLSLSLVSHSLRDFILSPTCEIEWHRAIRRMQIPELEASLKPVELATLVVGRSCRVCGKNTARKVDFYLRCRLCSKCWEEQIVYEGPDEPDPAFEEFFAGTKRYTPRSRSGRRWKKLKTFFFRPSLLSTSSFLSQLLSPQITAYESALEFDPLAELDDFMLSRNLPQATREELDERQEWVKRVWRDGEKLTKWYDARSKAEREEKKRAKAQARDKDDA
ncbi:uncharacterized protein JCM6883_002158 [Sporobolomyces salmoneus]|uniref:uncharacterized protein n=1 Tax=Sporobolomyces salmoneus TaxID=183962 RepID=UPI00317A58B4